ncbi:MAG: Fis family transcriptional regulator [Nitrospirae bacterium RBG_16_64_22]|nr:MAG: Fis family transcriptional regulator [Nitrospirae bacterium RBG_16_64_22]
MPSILVVDDDPPQREIVGVILEGEGYRVETAGGGRAALKAYRRDSFDVVLTDLKMPDLAGDALLDALIREDPAACVIMMTAHGTIASAVEAMKKGAFDYLTKPIDRDALLMTVRRAADRVSLVRENRRLKEELEDRFRIENLVGSSGRMDEVRQMIRRLAPTPSTVLITGESGTGKEIVARAVHFASPRRGGPFRVINCAAIPETLLESELFGYERGAFTGAAAAHPGLFEAAQGGTVLLDEIGEMPLPMQAKILRVLQEKEVRRVGGNTPLTVDVRILAATNRDLERDMRTGRFRADLYYRLCGLVIPLPPLRERSTDVPELAEHFLARHNRENPDRRILGITPAAMERLVQFPWPGNVRQLQSAIERAVVLSSGDWIDIKDLPAEIRERPISIGQVDFEIPDEGFSFEGFEREIIFKALRKSDGVVARAARLLGMSYRTLQYRLEKFAIKKEP